MNLKLVFLNIICLNKPCELTIVSSEGYVVKKHILHSCNTKICICVKDKKITLIAKYDYQTIYKTIYLNNCECNKICVNFAKNSIFSLNNYNNFTLQDANYGFPVKNGILKFKQIQF